MRKITLLNRSKNVVVGTAIQVADGSLTRLVGLIGRKGLDAGQGLLITPSSGVHTFGMSFPIDVVALDDDLVVVDLWPNLKPFRISGISLKIKSVLELPAGQISQCSIAIGDQLEESS